MVTRILNGKEKCELISALANARVNNGKKAKGYKGDSDNAHHPEDKADLFATAERYDMWAQLDEALIEAIRNNQIVIIDEDEGENV